MKDDLKKIGGRIVKLRMHLGFIQKEFAKDLGVHPAYLSQIEKGKNLNVGVAFFKKIADKYNVSLDYLISGKGDMFSTLTKGRKIEERESIKNIHNIDDLVWLMENSNLFCNMVLAQATNLFFENEKNIKESIERCKLEKEEAKDK